MILQDLLRQSAQRAPDAVAIKGPKESITYGELDRQANRIAHFLAQRGVEPGDRVGLYLEKSPRSVAAMQGVLRCGAAYVPLDPFSPARRVEIIVRDCRMKALVTTEERAQELLQGDLARLPALVAEGSWGGHSWQDLAALPAGELDRPRPDENDLAYILYTSGSTGTPKGVCISHLNALAFVQWAAELLQATADDVFANHAPFHFDLSVLDLYAAMLVGAQVTIVPEAMAYIPWKLVRFVEQEQPTIWYSVPSALILMMEHGEFLELDRLPMRVVIFAGEPFPIKHLARLQARFPDARLINMYGPTETNVCTYYEVSESLEGRTKPVPIGVACSGDRAWAVTEEGAEATVGQEGELLVSGPTVALGYWGKPPHGDGPYPTGDIVRVLEDGGFDYIGRRDHMVKVHGNRVELGEIEAALLQHPAIQQAAVVVLGSDVDAKLVAVITTGGEKAPGLLAVKAQCAERLPKYMIVDRVRVIDEMPRTRTGKIDRRKLTEQLSDTVK